MQFDYNSLMREREIAVIPEGIVGRRYEVPFITGEGTGKNFDFEGLDLPIGWQAAIPQLLEFDRAGFQTELERYCEEAGITPAVARFDDTTGLLTQIEVMAGGSIELSSNPIDRRLGLYVGVQIDDIDAAIALQQFTARFLTEIGRVLGLPEYAYLAGDRRNYYSRNLTLPENILFSGIPLTDERYQESFIDTAERIAQDFPDRSWLRRYREDPDGTSRRRQLLEMDFNGQGVLSLVTVSPESSYYLEPGQRIYSYHNVNNPEQAAALHGIVALHLRDLMYREGPALRRPGVKAYSTHPTPQVRE